MNGSLWGPLDPSADGGVSRQIGRCRIWARAAEDEWEIAYVHTDRDEEIPESTDESLLDWTRFVTVANDRLESVPALPDRAVVVRPASPIVILPGRWGRFFFRVPLWARFVSQPGVKRTIMEEIPSRRLASIWFGDMATGELCYAIEAPLQRSVDEIEMSDAFAACEVVVRNSSPERLRFERICVHVEHMRLFRAGARLWTNEVRVGFRGSDQVSQLTFLPRPPELASDATVVCEPRVPPEAHLLKRSFALIRQIAGM
ncbi:MAG: hypothetical protein ACOCY8_07095 [Spirochaetota bacterium]